MTNDFQTDDLRHALIIAGIKELEHHGFADFSLRRVSKECGVSCAAPYRHFKDKDALLSAIVSYINDQWSFLERQIAEIYANDLCRLITELCVSGIRFWIANPNFRSIMMGELGALGSCRMSETIDRLIAEYGDANALPNDCTAKISLSVRATVYGATHMIGTGETDNTQETIEGIKEIISSALKT